MMKIRTCLVALALCLGCNMAAQAEDWGDLTITFQLDGKAPVMKPADVNKDQAVCGKHKILDERLVVNPSNGGIANVLVWLALDKGKTAPIHDMYKEKKDAEVVFDNLNCRFEPHMVLVRAGQTLVVGNKDPVGHNTNVSSTVNPPKNEIIPANSSTKLKYPKEERLPVPISCNIHPWMKAYLLVKDTPYMAVSDENGKVEIKNLPAGKWTLQVWHETSGYVKDVVKDGKPTTWNKGRIENLVIKPGSNDLGEIKVPLKAFKL